MCIISEFRLNKLRVKDITPYIAIALSHDNNKSMRPRLNISRL